MTLDKIVDAYLILADLHAQKGCSIVDEDGNNVIVFSSLSSTISCLENLIDRCSRTKNVQSRIIMHHEIPLIWSYDLKRFVLMPERIPVDTATIEVK